MHGTARCFGYPSDSSPAARQQAHWTLPAEERPATTTTPSTAASPPPSCLAACSRARCHAGRVTGPGPGLGPLPPRLARRAPWARRGPVPRMPGPRGVRRGPVALTVCCFRRGLAGSVLPPLLRAFSRGRMPEWRIATAQRRWDPALAAARLVGVRCWGRHCRMRIAGCVHRGPLAASHGSDQGRGPERRSVTAQLSWGTGAERRGPRRSAHVGRGRDPRIACGSESQPERHCTASPGTGEVAAGPSLSLQSGPGDYQPGVPATRLL